MLPCEHQVNSHTHPSPSHCRDTRYIYIYIYIYIFLGNPSGIISWIVVVDRRACVGVRIYCDWQAIWVFPKVANATTCNFPCHPQFLMTNLVRNVGQMRKMPVPLISNMALGSLLLFNICPLLYHRKIMYLGHAGKTKTKTNSNIQPSSLTAGFYQQCLLIFCSDLPAVLWPNNIKWRARCNWKLFLHAVVARVYASATELTITSVVYIQCWQEPFTYAACPR